jgi:hypothetical protein
MESQTSFLERTRALREALKKRANDIESGTFSLTTDDILEQSIKKNIQSSLDFYKAQKNPMTSSVSLEKLVMERKRRNNIEKRVKEQDPFKLPEVKKHYMPYLNRLPEFPLPRFKKVVRYRVNFTGIEPKIKKLNMAYSAHNLNI